MNFVSHYPEACFEASYFYARHSQICLLLNERKVTKTFGVLVGTFIVCFAPAMGYYFVLKSTVVDPVLHGIVWRFIEVIMMLNSVLNFAVYFWRHGEKRVAVRKVIGDAYAAVKGCNCH